MPEETVELPEGFEAEYDEGVLTVEGNGGEVSKKMQHALVEVGTNGDVEFFTEETRKDIVSLLGTYRSHTENMIEGLQDEHVYTMKGVYAHFPMDIKSQGDRLLIENFMGEQEPREVEIEDGVEVSVDGEELEISGSNREAVGLTAGKIEEACKKGDRDPRTFQDGIYITGKGEKQ